MERPPKPPPKSIPAPWAPYAQRPLPARIHGLLARATLALVRGADEEEEEERRVERRVVGLTLETELRTMASRVGGGLSLHAAESEMCARLLEAAGEPGRAARLLWDAGKREDAARLAEEAGEIDLLQKALTDIHGPEERSHRAALAFAAYEAAFGSGRLTDALASLQAAQEARPDNPAYAPLRETLLARRPTYGRLTLLDDGGEGLVVAVSPAWLGRGEEAAVKVALPGVSRRHWQVVAGEAARLEDARGRALWTGPAPFTLGLGTVDVNVEQRDSAVWLTAVGMPLRALVVPLEASVGLQALGVDGVLRVTEWAQGGFPGVVVDAPGARFNAQPLGKGPREWAVGDELTVGKVTLRVG